MSEITNSSFSAFNVTNGYITFNVTLNILMAISAKYFIPHIFNIDDFQNILSYGYIASTLCLVICYAIIQTNTYYTNKKPDISTFNKIVLWNIVFTGLLIFLLKYSATFEAYQNSHSVAWYILNLFTVVYILMLLLLIVNILLPFLCVGAFVFFYFKHPLMLPGAILFPIIGFCLIADNVIFPYVALFYILSLFLVLLL
jgi:hypothetical protein